MSRRYTVQLTKVIVETVEAENELAAIGMALADAGGYGGAWDSVEPTCEVLEAVDGGAQ